MKKDKDQDETEYLMSSPANKARLLRSIAEAEGVKPQEEMVFFCTRQRIPVKQILERHSFTNQCLIRFLGVSLFRKLKKSLRR